MDVYALQTIAGMRRCPWQHLVNGNGSDKIIDLFTMLLPTIDGVIKIGAPTRQKRIYLDAQSLQTQNTSIQTLTRKYLSNLLRPQPISP